MRIIRLLSIVLVLAAVVPARAGDVVPDVAQPVVPKSFVKLQIGGRLLAWPQPLQGNLKLTWSLARAETTVEGVVNCGHMRAASRIGEFDEAHVLHEAAASFAYWQKSAAVDFEYVEDSAKALILIGVQQSPQGIAFADVVHKPAADMLRGEITRGLICLNGDARWKSGFDGNLKSYDIRFVLAHEIGHVLGLDHPSSTGQLMSWRYDERTRELQSGDVEGMASLYGLRPRLNAGRQ